MLPTIFRLRTQDLAASLKSVWEKETKENSFVVWKSLLCCFPEICQSGGYWAKMGCCNGQGTKKIENHWFSVTVSNAQRQEQSFWPYAGQPLREKVHIQLGSLHAANFIYCICDDSLFVYQKILCVYVLEKVKTTLHFF